MIEALQISLIFHRSYSVLVTVIPNWHHSLY